MESQHESDEDLYSDTETMPYLFDGERNESGQRHGKGKARLPNGDTYEGDYYNGYRHGLGKYVFQKRAPGKTRSASYTGYYEKNKKNGQGTFLYPDGAKYEGCWKNDLRQGFGCYFYTNGDTYRGDWESDQRHGYGTYTYANSGMRYEGQWAEGKRSGRGKLTFGKQSYIGNFHDDKMLGPGTYIFANGCQQHGEYVITEETMDDVDKGKSPDEQDESEAKRKRSHTTQLKFKWISHGGTQAPITVIRKETLIN